MTESNPNNPFREALRLGWGGAKANVLPGIALWMIGLALVISYYQLGSVALAFDQVGRLKTRTSPWFAMVSTAIFGSLIPWLVACLLLSKEKRQPFRQVPWLFVFWAFHGWQVDKLYYLQSVFFGNGNDVVTIVSKTIVDQFLWCPLLAMPQVVLFYLYVQQDLSRQGFQQALARKSYCQRAIPLLIANWVVWIPSVALIYLFPLALQLPLQNLILAIWCLIISFFSKNA